MDYAILANLLLFLGALGASFAIDQSGGEEQEDDTEAADTAGHTLALPHDPSLDTGEDSLAADRDTLAWFLNGDDAPLAITGAEGAASFSGTAGDDLMAGGAGDDSLSGDGGDDTLSGGDAGGVAPGDGADSLDGGAGDDLLILGADDSGTGGEGADLFALDHRGPHDPADDPEDAPDGALITDYDPTDDRLAVLYSPELDPETSAELVPEVSVTLNADGTGTLILLDGKVLAEVAGVTDLTADDIALVPDPDSSATLDPAAYEAVLQGGDAAEALTPAAEAPTAMDAGAGDDSVTGSAAGDHLRLGDGDDSASLGAGDDIAHGGAGDDSIAGGDGSDTILGDGGNDSIAGGAGADRLHGGAGDDTVDGSDDGTADYLAGGDGADALVIGAGDQARGGSGPDAFILSRAENAAVPEILDYAGDDRIELEYEPATGADGQPLPPVLTVAMGPDQAYAVIILDGAPVAHVAGPAAANLTAENIRLVAA